MLVPASLQVPPGRIEVVKRVSVREHGGIPYNGSHGLSTLEAHLVRHDVDSIHLVRAGFGIMLGVIRAQDSFDYKPAAL